MDLNLWTLRAKARVLISDLMIEQKVSAGPMKRQSPCLYILRYLGASVLLENPRFSKMAWLRGWKYLKSLPGVVQKWIASCAYGAPYRKEFRLLAFALDIYNRALYRKEFRLLTFALDIYNIHQPCAGCPKHQRIEGHFPKSSAIYGPRRSLRPWPSLLFFFHLLKRRIPPRLDLQASLSMISSLQENGFSFPHGSVLSAISLMGWRVRPVCPS